MNSLQRRRSARVPPAQSVARGRPGDFPDSRGDPRRSTPEAADEPTLKGPILEAEVAALRQLLGEAKANRDELRQELDALRRDRDHWRKLAEKPKPAPAAPPARTWFCGRATAGP
jgi:hypothetical protein